MSPFDLRLLVFSRASSRAPTWRRRAVYQRRWRTCDCGWRWRRRGGIRSHGDDIPASTAAHKCAVRVLHETAAAGAADVERGLRPVLSGQRPGITVLAAIAGDHAAVCAGCAASARPDVVIAHTARVPCRPTERVRMSFGNIHSPCCLVTKLSWGICPLLDKALHSAREKHCSWIQIPWTGGEEPLNYLNTRACSMATS